MVIIFGFSIKIWFKNTGVTTNLAKKWIIGPPLIKWPMISMIYVGGGVQYHDLMHTPVFLNQIFTLNPKIITIFSHFHYWLGSDMLLIFSDSYKKNMEKDREQWFLDHPSIYWRSYEVVIAIIISCGGHMFASVWWWNSENKVNKKQVNIYINA